MTPSRLKIVSESTNKRFRTQWKPAVKNAST